MLRKVSLGLLTATLAASLVACGGGSQAASAPASAASTGSNAPQTNSGGLQAASGTPRSRGNGFGSGNNAVGTVATINGTTLTLNSPQNGPAVTVQLTNTTTIHKQVDGTIGDIKPGQNIRAFGQQSNGILQARQIQIGSNLALGGARSGQGGAGRGTGGPGPSGRPTANAGSAVSGTVDSVSGNTVTIKTTAGSSAQVQLAANGRIIEETTGSTSDIKQGDFVLATGQRQGNTVTASDVSISNGPPGGNAPVRNGNS